MHKAVGVWASETATEWRYESG